jgi:hypothetical protein
VSRERYVLESSVRKFANHVRIIGQLIDASTGAHVWPDRFDSAIEDVFDLQDKVAASVVGAIAPKMEQAEIERARCKPTENLDRKALAPSARDRSRVTGFRSQAYVHVSPTGRHREIRR